MFNKLFTSGKNSGEAPAGAKIYAVGDIHGRADLLDDLLHKIAKDAGGPAKATLIFLGDYVDRGPDSRGVLNRLIALQPDFADVVFLKGNHEAAMLDFLSDPEDMMQWLDWGGEETLASYGVKSVLARASHVLAEDLRAAMPEDHLAFLQNLKLCHQLGDYYFAHAGVRPGVALNEQEEEDLLWIRGRFHNAIEEERPDKIIVHGHHPVKKAQDHGWRINVDTGAVWSDRLTALVLEDNRRRFLTT